MSSVRRCTREILSLSTALQIEWNQILMCLVRGWCKPMHVCLRAYSVMSCCDPFRRSCHLVLRTSHCLFIPLLPEHDAGTHACIP